MLNACIFILTYRRPTLQHTLKYLKKCKVDMPIYLVLSDDDPTISEYENLYGRDMIKVFNKDLIAKETKMQKIINTKASVVYARNYVFTLAKKLGYDFFIMLDDDYRYIYPLAQRLKGTNTNLTECLTECLKALKENPRIDCIALAQGGDMIGGVYDKKYIKRKIMNVFFCATDRDFKFYGTMNDDVSTYTLLGARGKLFLQIPYLVLEQCATQSQKGGLTYIYLEFGTYNKSMTTKIILPSACNVEYSRAMGRIHHRINYNRMPKLISGNYKKL